MRNKRIGHLEQDAESDAKRLMIEFVDFIDGTRYLSLLHRQKDGGSTDEYKRRSAYFVTHDRQEYYDALVRLLILQKVAEKPYRLYASTNSRNIKKAEKAFKMDMLVCDFDDGENKAYFWKRLPSKWVSALMSPGARDSSNFLIDVDGEGDVSAPVLKWLGMHGIEVIKQYKTPNGYHIVTPPFNPNDFDVPNSEIKKDALLLLSA